MYNEILVRIIVIIFIILFLSCIIKKEKLIWVYSKLKKIPKAIKIILFIMTLTVLIVFIIREIALYS